MGIYTVTPNHFPHYNLITNITLPLSQSLFVASQVKPEPTFVSVTFMVGRVYSSEEEARMEGEAGREGDRRLKLE